MPLSREPFKGTFLWGRPVECDISPQRSFVRELLTGSWDILHHPSPHPHALTPPDGDNVNPRIPTKDRQHSEGAGGVAFRTHPIGFRDYILRRPRHITPPQPSCRNEQTPSLLQSTRSTSRETSSCPPRTRQLVVRLHRLDTPLPTLAVLLPQPSTSRPGPGGPPHPAQHLPQLPLITCGNNQTPGLQGSPRAGPWLSAGTQVLPLRSRVLQPQVLLTRLPPQQLTSGTLQSGTEEEEDECYDFDVNTLYSSSESDEDVDCPSSDPSYRPHKKISHHGTA